MEKHLVICIGRQFGSGGREIGLGLAKKLGIRFYDKEILKKAAEESGIVEELFEKADEKPTNSFLYSLSMGTHGQAMNFTNYNDYLTNDKLFLFQSNTIRDMAEKDSCVIIGRCADYILRGRKDMLSVFIHAPMELRIHLPRAQCRRRRRAVPHQKDGPSARQLLQLLRGQRLGRGRQLRRGHQLRQAGRGKIH